MPPPNDPETTRRYREAYEWYAAREQQGRNRMKTAKITSVVVGVLSGLLVFGGVAVAGASKGAIGGGAFLGVLVGFLLGAIFYEWWYNSGLKMVLTAQQTLVSIDTEHNTREIAEMLRRTPIEPSQPAQPAFADSVDKEALSIAPSLEKPKAP